MNYVERKSNLADWRKKCSPLKKCSNLRATHTLQMMTVGKTKCEEELHLHGLCVSVLQSLV